VITHHAPSILSIAHEYLDERTHGSSAYFNRLEHLMGKPVTLWVHGQTHSKFDYEISGTHVVCNPRGYHGLRFNKQFDQRLVIEI
ncbi:MAG: metallophosphoesterase, partial [Burkholderiales bacterium]